MSDVVDGLFARVRSAGFPSLGRRVGDFPLFDALLAGCASRHVRGELVSAAELPVPDEETVRHVVKLRVASSIGADEYEFLQYFDLLEELRASLVRVEGPNG